MKNWGIFEMFFKSKVCGPPIRLRRRASKSSRLFRMIPESDPLLAPPRRMRTRTSGM